MRKKVFFTVVMVIALFFAGGELLAKANGPKGGKGSGGICSLNSTTVMNLRQMREEEKLARDVYLYFADEFGSYIFSNIADSEGQHMLALKNLIEKYGIEDSVKDDTEGVFTDSNLEALYDSLIDQDSEFDALEVGADIEDLDIFDLRTAICNLQQIEECDIAKEEIQAVYNNLMKGSRNHLRAFYDALGKEYDPNCICSDLFNLIISNESGFLREKGRIDETSDFYFDCSSDMCSGYEPSSCGAQIEPVD